MINGAHLIVYSTDPDADRSFFRDILKLVHVDAGNGWLNFSLPPAELAVHPASHNNIHELYLMCDDIDTVHNELSDRNVACGQIDDLSWGRLMRITLPGGGSLGIYEPRHARPPRSE